LGKKSDFNFRSGGGEGYPFYRLGGGTHTRGKKETKKTKKGGNKQWSLCFIVPEKNWHSISVQLTRPGFRPNYKGKGGKSKHQRLNRKGFRK